jgi:hypothetical protein
MMENKTAWQGLLRTLDNHQEVFNQQLARLRKENMDADSTSPFLGPVKQYSMSVRYNIWPFPALNDSSQSPGRNTSRCHQRRRIG